MDNMDDYETKKTNQFTYVERATQTYNKGTRDSDPQTDPPRKIEFCANVNQWIIYDKYTRVEDAKEMAEEKENRLNEEKQKRRTFLPKRKEDEKELTNRKMIRCSKILERMVNQNNNEEVAIGNVK